MSRFHEDVPPEFRDVDAELRARRSDWSPLELDRVKRRAMTGGRMPRPGAPARLARSAVGASARIARSAVMLAVAASVGVGGLAIAHTFNPNPGFGCNDFHHPHYQIVNIGTGETGVLCKPNKKKHVSGHANKPPSQQHSPVPNNHQNCRENPECFNAPGVTRSSLR